jgi:methylmalonyl-CoA mutase
MYYEHKKADGSYPIVGVNTYVNEAADVHAETAGLELSRGTEEEKRGQVERVRAFQQRHKDVAPQALKRLQKVATDGGNIFAELMDAVRVCSLGQITQALFEVGGQYRRSM